MVTECSNLFVKVTEFSNFFVKVAEFSNLFRWVSISSIDSVTHSLSHYVTKAQLVPNRRTPNKGKIKRKL